MSPCAGCFHKPKEYYEVPCDTCTRGAGTLETDNYTTEDPKKPAAWFVKDFADGFIHFDNEEDALREVEATGALLLYGYKEKR
jgi:hypothetical protein